ncbi:MAG: alpha/beta fold hydrolase [Gammaproteobacteria bacterium]|nr:alpha/beta fold hydrolase [Gammaproteobacteria bacterium]
MTEPQTSHPTDLAAIELAEHRWFYAGGRYVTRAGQTYREGAMYVEQYTPASAGTRPPVVMFHGGAQTGSNFTGTPDGRRGWLHDFLRAGYTVFVVDQPERGRSGHLANSEGRYDLVRYSAERIESRFTACADDPLWPQAALHTRWPGSGRRGDPVFDQFFGSQVQMSPDRAGMERMLQQAGACLLERIGPAILLTHSQSGPFGWLLADACPARVAAIIAIEPNGPPFHEVDLRGVAEDGQTVLHAYEPTATRAFGITHAPLRYQPPLAEGETLACVWDVPAPTPDRVGGYRQPSPARQLPNLSGIPILIVTAEASYHAPYDHLTSAFLSQAGVEHEHVCLAERGISGNGHMMMLESNNHEIADLLIGWLDARRLAG